MDRLPDPVSLRNSTPVLQILNGSHKGKQFRLLSSQITIGRQNDCDVIFKDNPHCSRRHARIQKQEDSFLIESLNPKNPVLINKKSITSQILKPKDKITIGNVELLFLDKVPTVLPSKRSPAFVKPEKAKKTKLNFPRLALIIVLIGGAFLFFYEDKKPKEKLNLKTESEILKEVETLETLNEEESEKKALSPREKEARIAFIKGFRDYRKGYFHRALKLFQHCLILHKTNLLCHSYSRKSKVHIDNLIQKKIRLGNAYKKNKHYEACRAAFKSVEIMIQDSRSAIYREAKANRRLCEIQLENKI